MTLAVVPACITDDSLSLLQQGPITPAQSQTLQDAAPLGHMEDIAILNQV